MAKRKRAREKDKEWFNTCMKRKRGASCAISFDYFIFAKQVSPDVGCSKRIVLNKNFNLIIVDLINGHFKLGIAIIAGCSFASFSREFDSFEFVSFLLLLLFCTWPTDWLTYSAAFAHSISQASCTHCTPLLTLPFVRLVSSRVLLVLSRIATLLTFLRWVFWDGKSSFAGKKMEKERQIWEKPPTDSISVGTCAWKCVHERDAIFPSDDDDDDDDGVVNPYHLPLVCVRLLTRHDVTSHLLSLFVSLECRGNICFAYTSTSPQSFGKLARAEYFSALFRARFSFNCSFLLSP